ncbi:MAG: beta-galactosidase [Holdemania massiliensis]
MTTFTIHDDFILDGQPIKLISGALHYFRIVPEYWQDRLEKLKNMGCNCVETYIPWNYHEPKKGQFDFTGPQRRRPVCPIGSGTGLMGHFASNPLYLRGMGIRRLACLVVSG